MSSVPPDDLLGAYAADALDEAERAALRAELRDRPERRAELTRLRAAAARLADAHAAPPPDALRGRVLDQAHAARAPGRSLEPGSGAPAAPADTLARSVARFIAALDALASLDGSAEGWARPTGLGLTVAQVAAHLGAAFDYAAGVVGAQDAPAPPQGPAAAHRAYTAAATEAADPARGEQLRRQCEASLRRLADWAAAAPAAELRRLVPYEGAEAPVLLVLTARAFEAWAHGEHVRAALGLPAAEPPPEDLALLCDVAVSLVPVAYARAGGMPTGRSARVVLLGPGGGTWLVSDRLGDAAGDPAAASATVVLGAFDLCRLTGGLASFDDVARQVEGDRSFAARLVSSLAVFAE